MTVSDEGSLEKQLRDEYGPKVGGVTPETLPSFISELMSKDHDYGSVCVAMGLAAAATAFACNKHEGARGGITGFQSGAVFWEFVRAWGSPTIGECGARMVNYENLLYPQYENDFKSITTETFEAVQKRAVELLAEKDTASPAVIAHWQTIALGQSPFGLPVRA
jgi:hypothetical protein